MMGRTRIGVIGCGNLAMNVHLPSLAEMPDVEIAAVCDEKAERAEMAASQFKVGKTYLNYQEFLEREALDGVFVLTEPDRLFRIAQACLERKLPAFMEKPPGITLFQTETLERLSKEQNTPIQVGFNRRYIPVVVEALRILRSESGISHAAGCFHKHDTAAFYKGCASAYTCDVIHCLDFIAHVAGRNAEGSPAANPVSAALIESRDGEAVANIWQGIMAFDNGRTASVSGHYMTGGRVHKLEVHGPGASAYIDLGFGDASCGAELLIYQGEGSHSLSSRGAGKLKRIALDGKDLAKSDKFYKYYGFFQEDQAFIHTIQTKEWPSCDISEGARTMRLAEYLYSRRISASA